MHIETLKDDIYEIEDKENKCKEVIKVAKKLDNKRNKNNEILQEIVKFVNKEKKRNNEVKRVRHFNSKDNKINKELIRIKEKRQIEKEKLSKRRIINKIEESLFKYQQLIDNNYWTWKFRKKKPI